MQPIHRRALRWPAIGKVLAMAEPGQHSSYHSPVALVPLTEPCTAWHVAGYMPSTEGCKDLILLTDMDCRSIHSLLISFVELEAEPPFFFFLFLFFFPPHRDAIAYVQRLVSWRDLGATCDRQNEHQPRVEFQWEMTFGKVPTEMPL